jgi:hypothetical protein
MAAKFKELPAPALGQDEPEEEDQWAWFRPFH